MTLQEFQQSIREGIPAELPAPKPYDPEVNHAISNRGTMLFWPVNLQKN